MQNGAENCVYKEIFVIGAGAMAEAFIRGMTERKVLNPEKIHVVNRSRAERTELLSALYGVTIETSFEPAAETDLVVVAVKPADVATALAAVQPFLHGQPVLSVAAGVTLNYLSEQISGCSPVVRTMPNIPVAVLAGSTAVSFSDGLSEEQRQGIVFLLGQLGEVVEIPEEMMDAATALSGSGPGFVSYFLEAMENAAVSLGFSPEMARKLLLQTVVGTAKTLGEWGLSPAELRQRVTSPGGTTHAGVSVMNEKDLGSTVLEALRAAAARSAEMGQQYAAMKK